MKGFGGHHLRTDYFGFVKDRIVDLKWDPTPSMLTIGHDYLLNRDLYFLHNSFNSTRLKQQVHLPDGDQFKLTMTDSDTHDSTDSDRIFDYPPTRHPKLNFFNYYPNKDETEAWHPVLKYMTETTLKRFSTMHCVEWEGS